MHVPAEEKALSVCLCQSVERGRREIAFRAAVLTAREDTASRTEQKTQIRGGPPPPRETLLALWLVAGLASISPSRETMFPNLSAMEAPSCDGSFVCAVTVVPCLEAFPDDVVLVQELDADASLPTNSALTATP